MKKRGNILYLNGMYIYIYIMYIINRYINRENEFREEKERAVKDRVRLMEKSFEDRAIELATERSQLINSVENDRKVFQKEKQTTLQEIRKNEIENKILIEGLKSKLSHAEEERDALSREQ